MNPITLHVDRNTTIWQCGCGAVSEHMDYSNICLTYEVIMIGPGNGGKYPTCLTSPEFEVACINLDSARRYVRRIAKDMEDGNIVVLRHGTSIVLGVGVVVGGYQYYPNFMDGRFPDIRKWNLCHCRRVRWLWSGSKNFNSRTLPIERLSKLWKEEVRDWLGTIKYLNSELTRPLHPLPA
jgi:hypothetical protein